MAIAEVSDDEFLREPPERVALKEDARADSLVMGVTFLLAITVLQKLVGFVRSIVFCGLMDDHQLGRWSLAQSFLLMAAPLAMLGIPGTFGRYFEYYRRRGQQRLFLFRTTTVCFGLGAAVVIAVLCFPAPFASAVFGDPTQTSLMRVLGVTLAAVIVFNFQTELLTAMRRVRAVSIMQLINSLMFAGGGLLLVWMMSWKEASVVISFAIAATVASAFAFLPVMQSWKELPREQAQQAPKQRGFWAKLLPLAGWLWLSDALFNLFDAADRFMIVHFASHADAEALVGQYHSSRVVPILLVAIAAMLSGVIMPYLSSDWESGRRKLVSSRVSLALKLVSVFFTAGSAVILLFSPLLFGWLLSGRYDGGLQVLPLTLVYCVWFSMIMISQSYLFCAEKAGFGSLALAVGLIVNVTLNRLLLPHLGLTGAVLATAAANGVALGGLILFSARYGLRLNVGLLLAGLLPLVLALGVLATVGAIVVVVIAMWKIRTLLSEEEKQLLQGVFQHFRTKFGGRTD